MTVKFYLNHPYEKQTEEQKAAKAPKVFRKEEVPVDVMISLNRKERFPLTTGERIQPKYWDKKANAAKANFRGHIELNSHLSRIKEELIQVWRDNKSIALPALKAIAARIVKGESQSQKKTVEIWIENFIKESKKKPSTKQVYNASLTHLKNYCAKYNIDLTWDSFDLDFYESFTAYLYSIGHNDNTVGKTIKTLKTFISEAFERNEHTNLNFKKKGFRVISAEVDEIYLNEQEIEQYYNADISSRPELLESKKKFVFDCWVGLRFSDLLKLGPNNALKTLSGMVLKITTTKTGEDVVIPFHPIALEIWQSWNGVPPRQSNASFNEDIKAIAELAKLDTLVQKRNTVKGVVTIEWVPKHTLVKAHTCRRSFATNCYLMGVPIQTIMAVTGHKTEKAFKKYIRITKEQHANIMMEYFNKTGNNQTIMRKHG
jgi:site-specific recombinase XerD